jgi:hypothetical protein
MKRTEYFKNILSVFEFKTVCDDAANEYVLLKCSEIDKVRDIADKTEFEAIENHIHLVDRIRSDELDLFLGVAKPLGNAVLCCLAAFAPQKHFRVYVAITLRDSMIVRFHQKWAGEEPYYNPEEFRSTKDSVFVFEN